MTATETGQGLRDDVLIERLRVVWQSYLTGPDTAQGLGELNKAAFMGGRMGRVLDHIAAQTQRIATLEAQVEELEAEAEGLANESNMLFHRAATRLARIKELEAIHATPELVSALEWFVNDYHEWLYTDEAEVHREVLLQLLTTLKGKGQDGS